MNEWSYNSTPSVRLYSMDTDSFAFHLLFTSCFNDYYSSFKFEKLWVQIFFRDP